MKKSGEAGRSGLRKSRTTALVFAGQQDDALDALAEHAIGAAIKLHHGQRKIRVLQLLPVKLFAAAVITGDRAFLIVVDLERPNLKWLGVDGAVMLLRNGDDVEEPIGAAVLGDVLGSIRVGDASDKSVAVPMFAAAELAELVFIEGMLGHSALLK